jgi:hypothetical protein
MDNATSWMGLREKQYRRRCNDDGGRQKIMICVRGVHSHLDRPCLARAHTTPIVGVMTARALMHARILGAGDRHAYDQKCGLVAAGVESSARC